MIIRRAFADLPDRQVHYRHAGDGDIPLVMLHASPASARQLEPLIGALAEHRRVIAADRPGNGDSAPLPKAIPEIADYAAAEIEFLDRLGIAQADLYGSHTGACVAVELAILAPHRFRKIIIDGISLFSPETAQEYLAEYAPEILPDSTGSHLQWAWLFCRDQSLFFPWFKPTRENLRGAGLPSTPSLHAAVLEVLKSIETYHLGYRAAFRHSTRARLPLVAQEVLAIAAADDPLVTHLPEAGRLLPRARMCVTPSYREPGGLREVADLISSFLDE